jgi:hypothetical protein
MGFNPSALRGEKGQSIQGQEVVVSSKHRFADFPKNHSLQANTEQSAHFMGSLIKKDFLQRKWGGQRDSNPQQQAPQAWTLPLSYDHQPVFTLVSPTAQVKFLLFENPCRRVANFCICTRRAAPPYWSV